MQLDVCRFLTENPQILHKNSRQAFAKICYDNCVRHMDMQKLVKGVTT